MTTVETVKNIVAEKLALPPDEVKEYALIKEELGADSLEKVEIVIALEEAFDIIIHDKDAARIRSIQDAADAVDSIRNN